jgi:CRISPR-associated endonuclease Cas2
MSAGTTKSWLVAYDIRCARRLRRVHRHLRRRALHVQYSAFVVEADDFAIRRLLSDLKALIDTAVDDVRSYHLPERCAVWTLGCQTPWREGELVLPGVAGRLLSHTSENDRDTPESVAGVCVIEDDDPQE